MTREVDIMASQGRGAKAKGAAYENKVAKMLSKYWGGKFHRVPASGGLQWGNDHRVAGDIVAPPEADFPFVVECKKQEGWVMEHIFLDIGKPREWWKQAVNDARRVGKTPMLVFSRNRAKDFVMLPYDGFIFSYLKDKGEIAK